MPCTVNLTTDLLKKYQNFDPVLRQLKSLHKRKTKPRKADITRTSLRYFGKLNNTTINENTGVLEVHYTKTEEPRLLLSLIL